MDFINHATEFGAFEALPDHARLGTQDASKALFLMGLRYTPKTLVKMRSQSTNGPRFIKVGHSVIYEVGALRAFAGVSRKAAA